jgi:zinc protease
MNQLLFKMVLLVLVATGFFACAESDQLKIDYQKYTLANGLEVILHKDISDPITSVAILYHVGSNREEPGRTGFAHLFEHMMFQESQHVGQDQFFKKIQEAGGTLNGGTWNDGTIYYQIVPKNALEMVLWMESDRMGYLLSTVTQEAFANQQNVVQNEKRQRVDNQPYGHTDYIIGKLLYPESHPYNWQVIGSMEDLSNATLEDVHNFYKKWYGPNNATIVVAGDFDDAQTRAWIEKYFGEIKSGPQNADPVAMPVQLTESRRAYFEDNFATSPELTIVFPTVEEYNNDSYALSMLGDLLADGKKAPLYTVIVEDKKLAPSVSAYQDSREIAGEFHIGVRAFANKNLGDVEAAVTEALAKFESEKFSNKDLERIKAKTETGFYNAISSIMGKSFQLAAYNEFNGDPSYLSTDLKNRLAVTSDDVWRVYNKYIKDKPFVLTSFVPKGQSELIAANSDLFVMEEEKIAEVAPAGPESEAGTVTAEKIATAFDRTVEPEKGPDPLLNLPDVWQSELANGVRLYGIEHKELPLIEFSLVIRGGHMLDAPEKIGTASLMAKLMLEGTKSKTPVELEEAIDGLGSRISINASDETITISGNALKSKFADTFALVKEILLEPRWDEKEFDRLKSKTLEGIARRKSDPRSIASLVFAKLTYGPDNILGTAVSGTAESVDQITIDDLKNFYENNLSPSVSYLTMTGDITSAEAQQVAKTLEGDWKSKEVTFPQFDQPVMPKKSQVYFVDVPDAKQSHIRIGYLALPYTDSDYFPAYVMNYKLGGSFSGNVNLVLREEKGWTYGARTGFSGSTFAGPFTASASVVSRYTPESVQIFHDLMAEYRNGISEEDLEFSRNALLKSNARRFETLSALNGMLNTMAEYNLPADFIKQQEQIIREMTLEQHRELAQKYILPDQMIYLVVGDARTQLSGMKKLGLGTPMLLDSDGNPVAAGAISAR